MFIVSKGCLEEMGPHFLPLHLATIPGSFPLSSVFLGAVETQHTLFGLPATSVPCRSIFSQCPHPWCTPQLAPPCWLRNTVGSSVISAAPFTLSFCKTGFVHFPTVCPVLFCLLLRPQKPPMHSIGCLSPVLVLYGGVDFLGLRKPDLTV